jgi:mono/diheme cytochrome c family protein
VSVLVLTAYVQFFGMIGGLPALLGTDYGHMALLKSLLFVLLLICAAVNRLVWTSRLQGAGPQRSLSGLERTLAAEVLVGLLMVAAAASLASTSPGIHAQPDWPFRVQFDVAGFYYPPMRDKLERSAAALLAALLLIGIGFRARRFAWVPFVGASALLLAAPIPQLDILFKPAHRMSFYVSPSTFPVAGIARGGEVFEARCAHCHDPKQRGEPVFAPGMAVVPPALSSPCRALTRSWMTMTSGMSLIICARCLRLRAAQPNVRSGPRRSVLNARMAGSSPWPTFAAKWSA